MGTFCTCGGKGLGSGRITIGDKVYSTCAHCCRPVKGSGVVVSVVVKRKNSGEKQESGRGGTYRFTHEPLTRT